MSDNYIIEVDSEAAGIVVRDGCGFRFFAATRAFNPLEGRFFRSAREAEQAAQRQMAMPESRVRAPGRAPTAPHPGRCAEPRG